MMNSNKWFKPHKNFVTDGLAYPLEFETENKYETYEEPPDHTVVKNDMNYVKFSNKELAKLGVILIGPNPFEQERIYFDKFYELETQGFDETEIIKILGSIPYG